MMAWRMAQRGLLGAALALGLGACPRSSDDGPPAEATANPAEAIASPDGAATSNPALGNQLPALPEGLPAHEAVQRLEASGYVVGAGITTFGQSPDHGCYMEAWDAKARPRALLLHLKTNAQGNFALQGLDQDPPESAWLPLLPDGNKEAAKAAAEANAKGQLSPTGIELRPTGPDGQAWQAEGGWQLVLAPGEESELVGPKGGGKLPLRGRWGEADRIQQVFVSPSGDQLSLVERLHHSGLFISHALALNPDTKTFEDLSMEGP